MVSEEDKYFAAQNTENTKDLHCTMLDELPPGRS